MSIKYDFATERGKPDGLLPLWVADMDFQSPPCVIEALEKVVKHGIFGYSEVKGDYFETVRAWFSSRYNFETRPEWLVKSPGVVCAIATAIRAFTTKCDAVLIQPPVYYPFRQAIIDNGRRLITNPLVYNNGAYIIDFVDFEQKIMNNDVKLFILCNPHNPVGRVWSREELLKMAEICLKHSVLVVSDEIHCDFAWGENKFTALGTLGNEYLYNSIICTAPTKTFNLAGLQISNIFIPAELLKRQYKAEFSASGYSQLSVAGLATGFAAYKDGAEWLDELREYLYKNIIFAKSFLQENLPQIRLVETGGTYLLWLDCKQLKMSDNELEKFFVDKARLWVDEGTMFGENGSGFMRINAACPKAILEDAFKRLKGAVYEYLY